MTRTEIENSLNDLIDLISKGQLLEAFDKYYHDDVVMQENNEVPTVSKAANRSREKQFLDNLVDFRKGIVKATGIGDNISFAIWEYDYSHNEWGEKKYEQVAVQQWQDGKIIHEKFIYN